MQTVGFIGLGIMGRPMALNLLKAGYSLKVFDLNQAAVQAVGAAGAEACASIGAVAAECMTLITMLPNSPQVREVALGPGGISENARPGTLLIDMSSIAPAAAQEVAATLLARGIRMLDAPVSGGEPKAVDGTLAIMAGGSETDFAEAKPLFDILGASAVLIGPVGSGNTCKLTNQIIVALNIAALSEGLMLAEKAGTDPEKVFQAIRGGLAGSTVMNAKAPMILDGNFKPGFKIDLHIKDLNNALETGALTGSPLPLTAAVQQMFQTLRADGAGQSDHSALVRYYEKLAGTQVRRDPPADPLA
ncbi:MAG TPA: 2-hydroxy-3-oxopropionate reductase [Clostridiales bacterium]|nr:2-hydroxy-3-oxopropionate reductase [Clostridiales bacterium]